MKLLLRDIERIAASPAVYERGSTLWAAGRVRALRRLDNTLQAAVRGETGERHVRIEMTRHGGVAQYACDCPSAPGREGACKHVVAALLKAFTDQGQDTPVTRASDGATKRLLRKYALEDTMDVIAENMADEERVALCATLVLDGQDVLLRLGIGRGFKYIIKDIDAFCTCMREHAQVEYGKRLSFFHHIDCFDPPSRALVRFVMGCCGASASTAGRELKLNPGQCDTLFSLLEGGQVSVICNAATAERRVTSLAPELKATVHLTQDHDFVLQMRGFALIRGARHCYVVGEDTIYRCDEEMTRACAMFLDALVRNEGSLFLSSQDASGFCASVLPRLREHIAFLGDAEALRAYSPLPLTAEIYLDAPGPDTIAARAWFCYGDARFRVYPPEDAPGFRRDKRREAAVKLAISRYFKHYSNAEGTLSFSGDAQAVYTFITKGVYELSLLADVFYSERFRNITITPAPRAHVGVRMENGLLEVGASIQGVTAEEIEAVLEAYRARRPFYRRADGSFLEIDEEGVGTVAALADHLGVAAQTLMENHVKVPEYRALYLEHLASGKRAVAFDRDAHFRALITALEGARDTTVALPAINGVLRQYQIEGFRWLWAMESFGFCGILADDMGLGKTLQMICLMAHAYRQGETQPSLVVCPASVVYNWQNEIRNFAPDLTTLVVSGSAAERQSLIGRIGQCQIAITSYELLRRDALAYEGIQFRYHIIDEAQYIKNHTTQNAMAVKSISSRARFALTGTPIENRLAELWSIFDFLMPGYLFQYARFRDRFEVPATKYGDEQALEDLRRAVAPYVLRRMKKDVLRELPPKTETVLYFELENGQRALYAAHLASARTQLEQTIQNDSLNADRMQILAMLTRLRQLCCDPRLCIEAYDGQSAKTQACIELIEEAVAGGHRLLVFSQFTSMLDILMAELDRLEIPYYRLDGATPKEERVELTSRFNAGGVPVFLISLRAGGTGLNLTGADVVIHFDPWWNLSAENQASDRAHRIGQRLPVQIYKLIARDTVEDRILELQKKKKELADAIIQEKAADILSMNARELLDIMRV